MVSIILSSSTTRGIGRKIILAATAISVCLELVLLKPLTFATLRSEALQNATVHLDKKPKPIIITGASQNHADVLEEFLQQHRFLPDLVRLVVVDLGLDKSRRQSMENENKWIWEWRTFNFSNYPPHVDINTRVGEYAWKPISILDIAQGHNDSTVLLWLDSGIRLAGPQVLSEMITHIERVGYFTTQTDGTVKKWVHPGTLNAIFPDEEKQKTVLHLAMGCGCIAGFDPSISVGRAILNEFAECALKKECIAPNGSSRRNHRQDQAVLTLLLYKHYGAMLRFPLPAEQIACDGATNIGISVQTSAHEPQNIMRKNQLVRKQKREEEAMARVLEKSIAPINPQQQTRKPLPRDSMLSVLASKVDRVYICCMKCDKIDWIHPDWAERVALVQGAVFDEVDDDAIKLGRNNNRQKTRMHRAVIAHAKIYHRAAITMVLEEDVQVAPSAKNASAEWADQVLNIHSWDVIRLDHAWRFGKDWSDKVPPTFCPAECRCAEARAGTETVDGACVLFPNMTAISNLKEDSWYNQLLKNEAGFCDLRSTAAYIVSARAYDHFLPHDSLKKPWNDVIDMFPVNAVPNQVILHPMPVFQKEIQVGTSKVFESKCVV